MVSLGIGIRLVFLGTAASCPQCVCICRSLRSSVLVRRKPHKLRDAMSTLTLFLSILARAIPSPLKYPFLGENLVVGGGIFKVD